MHVYFIDNENPFRDSSGGIMSYIVNVSKFLQHRQIKTSLIGSGYKDGFKLSNRDTAFSEYIPVTKKIIYQLFLQFLAKTDSSGYC